MFSKIILRLASLTTASLLSFQSFAAPSYPDFATIAEKVSPSVVNISTTEKVVTRLRQNLPPGLNEDFLDFFRRFGLPVPNIPDPSTPQSKPQERERTRGVGSGFIYGDNGLIMTNAHVVQGASKVTVTLTDGREFEAKILGLDKRTDVAVVSIDKQENLPPALPIGDVEKLRVGEWVLAIGSPFGLSNTVTAGIVSAKQRETGSFLPFIQSDVAVNPGNSGGPLIDMQGQVVGINSQIYSGTGGYLGISFAIPIDEAMGIATQLEIDGKVERGRIGVRIGPVSKEVAEVIGLGEAEGALVQNVEKDSPAEVAGLQAGDIIVAVDGQTISKVNDLPRVIGAIKPGTDVRITIFRNGNKQEVTIKVGTFDTDLSSIGQSQESEFLGVDLVSLTEEEKKELGLTVGLKVEAVELNGLADRAGVKKDDIIISVNNKEVATLSALKEVIDSLDKEKAFPLLVRRGSWVQYIVIRPNQK